MDQDEAVTQSNGAEQTETETTAPAAPAPKAGMGLRLKVLLVLLVICAIGAVGMKVHGAVLARSLTPLAEQRMQEFSKNPVQGEEYAADVFADREFGLYGEMLGKVAIYVKTATPSGDQYAEVDYMYTRNSEGGWTFKESGGCADGQCRVYAMRAFAKKSAGK